MVYFSELLEVKDSSCEGILQYLQDFYHLQIILQFQSIHQPCTFSWELYRIPRNAAYDEGETLSQNFYSTGTGGVAAAQFSGQTTMSSSDAGPIEPSRHPYTLRTSSLLGLTKFNLTVDDYFITATKRGGLINKQHSSFIIRRKDVHAIENGAYVRSNAWSRNVMIGFVAFSILTVFWGAILLPLFIYIALRGKAELSLRYLVVTPGYPAINYGRLTFPREGVRTRFMQLSNSVFRDLTFDDPQYVIYLKSGFTGKSSLRVFGYYVEVEKTSGIFPRTQNIVFPLRNIISVRTDPLKRRSNKMAFIGFLLCLTLFGIVIGLPLVIIGLSKRTKLKVVYSLIGGDVGEVQIEGKFGGSMQQLYEYSNRLFSIAELRRGGHRR